jgi:hypothetical protein
LVTAFDVVTYLLDQFVLPEMPVRDIEWAVDLDELLMTDPVAPLIDDPIVLDILRRYTKRSPPVAYEAEEDL